MSVRVTLYHDKRFKKKSGKYPVRLQVHSTDLSKRKYFSLPKMDLTEKEFAACQVKSPRGKNFELQEKLKSHVAKAESVIDEMPFFDFDLFKKKYFRASDQKNDVFYHYEEVINELSDHQVKTKESYKLSLRSIKSFLKYKNGKTPSKFSFLEITPKWLKSYQDYMTEIEFETKEEKKSKKSITTVGIYLRCLRRVYRTAIELGDVNEEYYPFGASSSKYSVPKGSNNKRFLRPEELRALIDSKPSTDFQQMAKDFWLFSYNCNGMNFKDIALLEWKAVKNDHFEFVRAKTKNTSRDQKPVLVYLNEFSSYVIEKYGSGDKKGYVFEIIKKGMNEQEKAAKIGDFIRTVNANMKRLCKSIGLPEDISTYWARHTFATIAMINGASPVLLQKSLDHKNLNTTQSYLGDFPQEMIRSLNNQLMQF